MRPWFERAAACAAFLTISAAAWSATAPATFNVSAGIVPACSVAATPLAFGSSIPSPITANVDAQSVIGVLCSTGTPYSVALNPGNGAGATFATRRLTSGANTLGYSLYRNAARTQLWGDGTGGSTLATATGSGTAQALTVFGRIPNGQTAPAGSYTDTINVTVTF